MEQEVRHAFLSHWDDFELRYFTTLFNLRHGYTFSNPHSVNDGWIVRGRYRVVRSLLYVSDRFRGGGEEGSEVRNSRGLSDCEPVHRLLRIWDSLRID